MVGKIQSKVFAAFLFTILVVSASYQIFSHTPFLQQEMVYQANWWNDGSPFLETLFDPKKTDNGPAGRFRYVEYLSEALYWKLSAIPLLPRDLHDYFAWFATLCLSAIGLGIAQRRKLPLTAKIVFLGILWFSIPTFMVTTWHYRKAKVLVSVFFFLTAFVLERKLSRWWLLPIGIAGFYTDPYFILLAPLLPLAWDISTKEKWLPHFQISALTLVTGIVGVLLLNGWIGPKFNPKSGLVLTSIPGKPENFLNLSQWSLFSEIPPQILGLTPSHFLVGFIPLLIMGFLFLFWLGSIKFLPQKGVWLSVFLVALPISAIVVHPSYNHEGIFASYYGHPTFALFLLALLDILQLAEKWPNRLLRPSLWAIFLIVIFFHQTHRERVFERWTKDHVDGPITRQKWEEDYKKIKSLARELPKTPSQNLAFDWNRFRMDEPMHIYSDNAGLQNRTSLAYLLTPILFRREIREGRLRP